MAIAVAAVYGKARTFGSLTCAAVWLLPAEGRRAGAPPAIQFSSPSLSTPQRTRVCSKTSRGVVQYRSLVGEQVLLRDGRYSLNKRAQEEGEEAEGLPLLGGSFDWSSARRDVRNEAKCFRTDFDAFGWR